MQKPNPTLLADLEDHEVTSVRGPQWGDLYHYQTHISGRMEDIWAYISVCLLYNMQVPLERNNILIYASGLLF